MLFEIVTQHEARINNKGTHAILLRYYNRAFVFIITPTGHIQAGQPKLSPVRFWLYVMLVLLLAIVP